MVVHFILIAALLAPLAVHAVCPSVFPQQNDVGLFWARLDENGTIHFEKSCTHTDPVELAAGFVCGRETHIYAHGLYTDAVEDGTRIWETEAYASAIAAYVAKGYNIGFFEYSQLADNNLPEFQRVQGKIEDPRYIANMEFTCRNAQGTVQLCDGPTDKSVSRIFAEEYAAHMDCATPFGAEIRLIGHSLGGALVVGTATLLNDDPAVVNKPVRVAELDPVYSNDPVSFFRPHPCGSRIPDVVACRLQKLQDSGIANEYYLSSALLHCLGVAQEGTGLIRSSAFARVHLTSHGDRSIDRCYITDFIQHPKSLSGIARQVYSQHMDIVPWYMKSVVGDAPPRRCMRSDDGETCRALNSLALSGGMSTADVLAWSIKESDSKLACFDQWTGQGGEGAKNDDPADDVFFVRACNEIKL